MSSVKVLSWNVNGMRSVAGKGFFEWLSQEAPDVLCLQETKARIDQLDEAHLAPLGYQSHWHSAVKPGYSGVALYCKESPKAVTQGLDIPGIDSEGRVLTADFGDFVVVNAYFPNSQREHARLPYKLEFCKSIFKHVDGLAGKHKGVVLCGDYNIAHKEIDLKNPKANKDNAGFLPEERAWMDYFVDDKKWVDTFRKFTPGPDHYSWWSYRPGIRERNIGWRIDYHCVNPAFAGHVKDAFIMPDVFGSDHCPVGIELN